MFHSRESGAPLLVEECANLITRDSYLHRKGKIIFVVLQSDVLI